MVLPVHLRLGPKNGGIIILYNIKTFLKYKNFYVRTFKRIFKSQIHMVETRKITVIISISFPRGKNIKQSVLTSR